MESNLLLEQYSWYKKQQLAKAPFECLLNADIEPNPHQVNAFCAAIQALKTGGIILADEVGLGKTIEAGLVLNYVLDNGAKKVLISLPATLRKQWEVELLEKFGRQAVILDRYTVEHDLANVQTHLGNADEVSIVIASYDYSSKLIKRFPHIPVVSFPYMHVCSNVKCGRIFDLRENFDLDRYLKFGVTCPECHRQAYPSRFITICENGHMDDFPWSWWVHGGNTTCKGMMRMYSTGNTSTLADMWVECSCGARRSMSGATQHENFGGMKCSGHHPFRPNHKNEKCDKEMIPSQRGASNVYFPVMRSAISIPPWINPLYNLIDEHLRLIDSYEEDFGEMGLDKVYQKYFSAFTREEFGAALLRRRQNIKEFTEIKQMEYSAITHHADPVYASNKKHFKAEEDPLPDYLLPYFKRVIRITRLREVRVLLGFTRVDAPDPDADEQTNIVYLNKGKTEKSRIDRSKNVIALFVGDTYDEIDSDIVQIDSRADVIIFSSSVVTAKMDLMQRFFGFEQYIRAGAQKTIEIIRDLDIVDSLEKFVAFENKSKLTNAKKLLKAKNSPVLQMKKNDLLENLKKHSRYKTMFKFEEDHIVISSQKEAAAFIKMLNDDIVRSELTGKEYDSSSKMLLGPVGASH